MAVRAARCCSLLVLGLAITVGIATARVAAQTSLGPSFNCAAARQPVEQTICGDTSLAEADQELDTKYRATRAILSPEARQDLEVEERIWLRQRNSVCARRTEQSLPQNLVAGGSWPNSASPEKCLATLYSE